MTPGMLKSALPAPTPAAGAAPCLPALELCNVTKHFSVGHKWLSAVRDVSLEIGAGEVTLLMGPSGSGKTTLLSMMGCILHPTSGRVIVAGSDTTGMSEAERSRIRLDRIGFVFQSYNLFPSLTARENVEIALDLRGVTRQARREQAQDLLRAMALADKTNAYPRDLSGGQKQRVAIARALAGMPAVVLADEPTAALDSAAGRSIAGMLAELARARGCAVVIVSHDHRLIEFADRLVTIEDGRVAEDKRPVPLRFSARAGFRSTPVVAPLAMSLVRAE